MVTYVLRGVEINSKNLSLPDVKYSISYESIDLSSKAVLSLT